MEKELRGAVADFNKNGGWMGIGNILVCVDLAQSYLELKGWPEEKDLTPQPVPAGLEAQAQFLHERSKAIGWNEALHLCKLASLKDKVEVMSEEEVENIISNTLEKMNTTYRVTQSPLLREINFILLPSERLELAHALSGKILKPKKIGREEIREVLITSISCSYHHTEEIENTITAILKLLEKERIIQNQNGQQKTRIVNKAILLLRYVVGVNMLGAELVVITAILILFATL